MERPAKPGGMIVFFPVIATVLPTVDTEPLDASTGLLRVDVVNVGVGVDEKDEENEALREICGDDCAACCA